MAAATTATGRVNAACLFTALFKSPRTTRRSSVKIDASSSKKLCRGCKVTGRFAVRLRSFPLFFFILFSFDLLAIVPDNARSHVTIKVSRQFATCNLHSRLDRVRYDPRDSPCNNVFQFRPNYSDIHSQIRNSSDIGAQDFEETNVPVPSFRMLAVI